MDTAELITFDESCHRAGHWAQSWEKYKLTPTQMLQIGVESGVMETKRKDWGEFAGETVYGLGVEPGIISNEQDHHSEVVHLACIADIATCAVRRPGEAPWKEPDTLQSWSTSALLSPDGSHLRRIVFVSNWSDDRHYSVCRGWQSLGDVCHYNLPMQIVVVVLGQHRSGKYHSYWSHGLRHPVSKQLRFRKKNDKANPFKNSWLEVWRSDFDEISTQQWLAGMLDDGVLKDCCFKIDVQVPDKDARRKVIELAARKLDRIAKTKTLPDIQYTGCDWPQPCLFRSNCHKGDEPSGRYGFVRTESLSTVTKDMP